MIKLIALDLDGTLLNSEHQISHYTQAIIQKAQTQGIHIVLASGRPLDGMMAHLNTLNLTTNNHYVVSYNGGLVQCVGNGNTIAKLTLTGKDAKNLAGVARDLGVFVHAFTQKHGLITPEMNPYTEHEANINGIPITLMDFTELEDDDIVMKVMMIDAPEKLTSAIEQLPKMVKDKYAIVQSAPIFLEFLNPNATKGSAVAALAEHLGIVQQNVMCMGDAGNDHSMIEWAGIGVAMGNADPKTQALANALTDTNDQDGVAKAIEKWALNH